MANQACISIGINQYEFLPPLGYGLADAGSIEHFFVDAAGWSPAQCLLLTDISPRHSDKSTYPDRENIDRWIQQWSWDTLQAGGLLWFFFSGCGISFEGEDYLIPIDGNVADLPNTCISIRQLYQQLHDTGVNALVFLDANRSIHRPLSSGIGEVTARLAQDYQIPTFLSCQSHEFSHEDAGLGHGLFTTALLEALQYHQDLNLGTIDAYLTSRLAELSDHHWKPLQTPVAIVPTTASVHRPIFSATTYASISTSPPAFKTLPTPQPSSQQSRPDFYAEPTPQRPIVSPSTGALARISRPISPRKQPLHWASVGFLLTLMVAAGGAVFVLFHRQPDPAIRPTSGAAASIITSIAVSDTTTAASQIATLTQAQDQVTPNDATSRLKAIRIAHDIPPTTPDAAAEVKQSIDRWSQEIAVISQGYADLAKWELAVESAKMVPPDASNYQLVRASIDNWSKQLAQ